MATTKYTVTSKPVVPAIRCGAPAAVPDAMEIPAFTRVYLDHVLKHGLKASIVVEDFDWNVWPWGQGERAVHHAPMRGRFAAVPIAWNIRRKIFISSRA